MHPVLGVTPEGEPVLPVSGAVLTLECIPKGDPSQWIAVCKTTHPHGHLIVLGFVSRKKVENLASQRPVGNDVIVGTEKAQIRLTPDGRVRIHGEDIKVEARGRMALGGATIDLN